jgi:hypothetical protein
LAIVIGTANTSKSPAGCMFSSAVTERRLGRAAELAARCVRSDTGQGLSAVRAALPSCLGAQCAREGEVGRRDVEPS